MHLHKTSRVLLGAFGAMAIATGFTSSSLVFAQAGAPPKANSPVVSAVDGVEVVVSDLARSRSFFESIGFTLEREDELSGPAEVQRTGLPGAHVRRVQLALGDEHLALLQYLAPSEPRPVPLDSRGNDLWFQHVAI